MKKEPPVQDSEWSPFRVPEERIKRIYKYRQASIGYATRYGNRQTSFVKKTQPSNVGRNEQRNRNRSPIIVHWKSVKSVVTILFLVFWLFSFSLASLSFEIEEKPFTPPNEEKRIIHPLSYSHYSLGVIYDEEGDFKKAIKQYERALRYAPDSSTILTALGKDYLRLGKFKEAKELFRQSLWTDPLPFQTHFLLGTLYIEKGEIGKARECYERAIDLEPDYTEAHFILGNLYARKDNWGII